MPNPEPKDLHLCHQIPIDSLLQDIETLQIPKYPKRHMFEYSMASQVSQKKGRMKAMATLKVQDSTELPGKQPTMS